MIFTPFSFKEFPSYDDEINGVTTVQGDSQHLRCRMQDIVYQEDRILRLLLPNGQEEGFGPWGSPLDPDDTEALRRRNRYPLIVHVQGSGWFAQDMNDHIFDLKPVACMGYAIAIVQYHEAPGARFPQQIIDVKRALRFLQQHAEEYPIDMSRVYLSGDSSGAHAMLLALFSYGMDAMDDPGREPLPPLSGAIDFYGVTDMNNLEDWWSREDFARSPRIRALLGEKAQDPAALAEASPISWLREGMTLPPLLILHGSKDTVVPFTQSLRLYQKMRSLALPVQFVRVHGADHGGSLFFCEAVYQEIKKFLET